MIMFMMRKYLTLYAVLLIGETLSVGLTLYLYRYAPISSIKPIHTGYMFSGIMRGEFLSATYGFMIWNLMSGFAIMALALPVIQYFVPRKSFIGIALIVLQVLFFFLLSKSDPYVALLVEAGATPSLLMFFASMEIDSRFFGRKQIEGLRAGV